MDLEDLLKVTERAWGIRWGIPLNHLFSLQAASDTNALALLSHNFSQAEYQCK
jgi:hypothetical protein